MKIIFLKKARIMKAAFVILMLLSILSPAQAVRAEENQTGRLAAGQNTMFFVNTDGGLWGWGQGRYVLNDMPGNEPFYAFMPVKIMDSVQSVSAAFLHAFVIKTDGTLWAWGDNRNGVLGCGDSTNGPAVYTPVKVLDSVSQVVTGTWTTMAIRTDGSLWGCGDNSYGQLGLGDLINRPVFTKIMDKVQSVAVHSTLDETIGPVYTLAVKQDGSLWGFGDNWSGVFHNGKSGGDEYSYDNNIDSNIPVKITDNVKSVYTGRLGSCYMIKNDNSLWDLTPSEDNSLIALGGPPQKIMDNVMFVTASDSHTIVVQNDGSLWTWGRNDAGELGDGTITTYSRFSDPVINDKTEPEKITDNIITAAAGFECSAALRADGTVWTWGNDALAMFPYYSGAYDQTRPAKVISSGDLPELITGQGNLKIVLAIGSKTYTRNGKALNLVDTVYLSEDNRAMVPIRIIAQELGATVGWDSTNRAAVIKANGKALSISLVNPQPTDGQGQLSQYGNMMAPVRFIVENLGAQVTWNSTDKTVTIIK